MKLRLNGLVAAPFTPMRSDRSLNVDKISEQARALAANGVSGAFICGTTGEGFSLSTEERMRVAEAWVGALPKSAHVIVHVGHNSMEDSRALVAHAEKIGASAFATIGPNFFRPANVDQLVGYCEEVASAAPKLPFYFYHMPAMTGINFAMIDFLRAARERIPNLNGIKFTHENLMDYAQCVAFEGGRFDVLFGRDEILLGALALGATGAVGSTYNYMAPVYKSVIAAFQRGDIAGARQHQLKAIEIIEVMARHGGLPAGKAMMKMAGVDCGPSRLPLRTLTTNEVSALEADLEKVGFRSVVSVMDNRAQLTFRYDNWRAVAGGIVESASGTFLLLLAVRWLHASPTAKGLIATGGSVGYLCAPFIVSSVEARGWRTSTAAARLCEVGAVAFLVAALLPIVPLFVVCSVIAMATVSATIPLMTQIYQENYAANERGRRFARTLMIRIGATVVFTQIGGMVLDAHIALARVVLLVFAISMALAAGCLKKFRHRRCISRAGPIHCAP